MRGCLSPALEHFWQRIVDDRQSATFGLQLPQSLITTSHQLGSFANESWIELSKIKFTFDPYCWSKAIVVDELRHSRQAPQMAFASRVQCLGVNPADDILEI